jgi:hypothetical protein
MLFTLFHVMTTQMKATGKTYFQTLTSRANSLAEQFGLNDRQTSELRSFVVDEAKAQYKSGSKSGAAWAFEQQKKPHGEPVQV